MKVVYLNPKDLIPYAKNAKKHPERQIETLMAGIKEYGFDQPIVVDQDMVIIKGHGRREAAVRLEMDTVPVVVRQISKTEAKYLRVADNEVNTGSWDSTALRREMRDLSTKGFELSLTGFELDEQTMILSVPDNQMSGNIEVGPITTSHECNKCNYRW